ncbi:hypothetical protein EOA23_18255 [Mesorhizobium sp. M2A.F.Ca.ET.042.01.1.1]|nr:hypothetical protein EOA23_18255 [Mesorhizobium sp. M2A.F.Ca.ET.042.01.1.1]
MLTTNAADQTAAFCFLGAPEVWLTCAGDWRKRWGSQSPFLWEKGPAGQRGAVPPAYQSFGSSPQPKAGERWPRSGRRGPSQGASLSASASPSHLSPLSWDEEPSSCERRVPSRPPLSCRTSPPQGGRLAVTPAFANRKRRKKEDSEAADL